ncbi:NfeD family protein [Aurantiacibacter gangjinensis]|uniref:Membrane protein n=1 Tax=Aurantiacibacter gangjinensis TaxID=502682 RepID=A0A0G9MKQ5_9SPHN|nr:NfeD family protein [Aurantiacibacter gangjinensis]APE27173.1 Putative activity regulator of membrane protease YbbK [Aurantiacibacter gangjinensis]KLE31311.1 membrane protein [Aurantiacibacter gangjinensis]
MDWLSDVDHHFFWLALGFFLAAAEILVPGVFLIWLAGAAVITGIIAWGTPIGIPLQIALFAVLAILALFSGKRYVRDNPIVEADPKMNRRGARLAGETAIVVVPIDGGSGRVKHGDSEWIARGPDAALGERVRITGTDGAILLVEKVEPRATRQSITASE